MNVETAAYWKEIATQRRRDLIDVRGSAATLAVRVRELDRNLAELAKAIHATNRRRERRDAERRDHTERIRLAHVSVAFRAVEFELDRLVQRAYREVQEAADAKFKNQDPPEGRVVPREGD